MGYGIGWLTHSALVLDQMDNAGRLLVSIARYTYDKNMNYADSTRGIDWRKWMWIIPEGANIMPDGRWYRICDLSNGANQGPAMNALEICAGVDDSRDDRVRLLPRIPDPLNGLEVTGARVMTRSGDRLESATIDYAYRRGQRFTLRCDKPVPALDIRFGPYTGQAEADRIAEAVRAKGGADVRVERSGSFHGQPAYWVWIENITGTQNYEVETPGL